MPAQTRAICAATGRQHGHEYPARGVGFPAGLEHWGVVTGTRWLAPAGGYCSWVIWAGRWTSGLWRAWREQPGPLLAAFLVLYALSAPTAFTLTHNSGIGGRPAVLISIPWLFLVPVLTWRVWRGGRISRVWLIVNGVAGYAGIALHLARLWRPLDVWLLADFAAQVALLVSPAVYQRTRPRRHGRAATAAPLAGQPRGWMLPGSLLAGLVITLLLLSHGGWTAIPGCGPASASLARLPGRCIGLAEGYPLRFLFGHQDVPYIDQLALIKDWAQWSLVSGSVLYAFQLLRRGRQDRPEPAQHPHNPPPVQGITQRV